MSARIENEPEGEECFSPIIAQYICWNRKLKTIVIGSLVCKIYCYFHAFCFIKNKLQKSFYFPTAVQHFSWRHFSCR